jgi:hypothetical protein
MLIILNSLHFLLSLSTTIVNSDINSVFVYSVHLLNRREHVLKKVLPHKGFV